MTAYDRIGNSYALTRQADPRIAAAIHVALGDARSVLNVGAGAGSYEPSDRAVIAVEPSRTMLLQRPTGSAAAVQAIAERLPFRGRSFDAAMTVLSLHHWTDARQGLAELRRVSKQRVVVFTHDPAFTGLFWLVRSYFPDAIELDRARMMPIGDIVDALGGGRVIPVPVPHDCLDGFLGAFWRRPAAYLDPIVRAGVSYFSLLGQQAVDEGLRRLASDLDSGEWTKRFGFLLALDELDLGYRLVVAEV